MLHLTLAGLSDDKQRLLLVSDSGERFSLDVDTKLRAAVRGDRSHIGQLEIQMESTLRPRDIQARIRAGETPEAVAQAAQTTVERIAPFVNPVLAERAHVAERAQRSSVRRRSGEPGARTLGEAVAAQLRAHDVTPDSVLWDAWRREDGRWTLVATYEAADRLGTGHYTYDIPGNYVVIDDDDARWLVGDLVTPGPAAATPRDDLEDARNRRRAVAEGSDQLALGDDALALIDAPPEADTVDLTDAARAAREARQADDPALAPTPEPLAEADPVSQPPAAQPPAEPEKSAAEEPQAEPSAAPRRTSRRKGRASVPSWDEIMFGGSSD